MLIILKSPTPCKLADHFRWLGLRDSWFVSHSAVRARIHRSQAWLGDRRGGGAPTGVSGGGWGGGLVLLGCAVRQVLLFLGRVPRGGGNQCGTARARGGVLG